MLDKGFFGEKQISCSLKYYFDNWKAAFEAYKPLKID